MELDTFVQQIQMMQYRFNDLKHRLEPASEPAASLTANLVEELSIALEELHLSAEELQEQHELLMVTRDALAIEQQRYQDLFEFAPNGYLTTDAEGHIQAVNQAAVALLRLPQERLLDKLLVLFIPVKDRKVFRASLSQIQTTLQPIQDLECHIQQPNSTVIPCEITASPICHSDINPRERTLNGIRWLIRDISERKQIAEMETASRVKDEFLAIVSHELRSPLNPILGWSSLLRNGRLDAVKTAHALEIIERNAKVQVQLIEDLLDVSRVLRGKLNLDPAPVDLVAVVRAALETVQLAAEAKNIELSFYPFTDHAQAWWQSQPQNQPHAVHPGQQPAVSHVLGDSHRLQQVVWNLLANAIKFTPEGGRIQVNLSITSSSLKADKANQALIHPTICQTQTSTDRELEFESQTQPRKYAQITVRDTGQGIASDFLPHVFEYFRQADSSSTRQFGGLGLGLAIVRHLVELHGGIVQAESDGEGQGATFMIRLPLLQSEAAPETQPRFSSTETSPDELTSLTGLRVLLVDDDPDNLNFTAFLLEQHGAIVQAVESVAEALHLFDQTDFDLLLSDIAMPEADGYALLHQIRSMQPPAKQKIPAIALTAYSGETNQKRAVEAGFQAYLAKPVSPTQLIQQIMTVVGNVQNQN